jgi:hypothetical protein
MVSSAYAATAAATFVFPIESEKDIKGFQLIRDGVVDIDNIPKNVRSFNVNSPAEIKDSYTYVIVAVGLLGQQSESLPYVYSWTAPTIPKPTTLRFRR